MADVLLYPLINGVRHSFSSVELKFTLPNADLIIRGIKSINYARKRGRSYGRGNHPDPLFKTRGENEYNADVEMYLAELNLIMVTLGPGYGDVFFTTKVTYSENGLEVIQDEIIGCTLDTTDASNAQGADPTTRKAELTPLKIRFNGLEDVGTGELGIELPLVGVNT